MLGSHLCLGEEVDQLKSNDIILHLCPSVRHINTDMLGELMLHRITSYADSTSSVRQERAGVGTETKTSRFSSNQRNQVTWPYTMLGFMYQLDELKSLSD